MHAQLNGRPATADQLAAAAVGGYGHFTTLRVTDRRARGLDEHLDRLADGNRRVFDAELDHAFVRACLRRATPAEGTVIARVTSVGPPSTCSPDVLVTVREAANAPTPVRLRTVRADRAIPTIKHVGTFAQHFHARSARNAGYDDALFVTADGYVSETSVCNVGFIEHARNRIGGADGDSGTVGEDITVVWPRAPMLTGVTQTLLTRGLERLGVAVEHRRIPLSELGMFRAAFVCNAGSLLRPVTAVDDVTFPVDPESLALLWRAYETNPAEPI